MVNDLQKGTKQADVAEVVEDPGKPAASTDGRSLSGKRTIWAGGNDPESAGGRRSSAARVADEVDAASFKFDSRVALRK